MRRCHFRPHRRRRAVFSRDGQAARAKGSFAGPLGVEPAAAPYYTRGPSVDVVGVEYVRQPVGDHQKRRGNDKNDTLELAGFAP